MSSGKRTADWAWVGYGLAGYLLGLGVLGLFVLWVAPWQLLPWHIDAGRPVPPGQALAVDAGLLLLFGLQHSLMARPGFNRWLGARLPAVAVRSTYVWLSALAIGLICAFWQPLEGMAWSVDGTLARWVLGGGFLLGWGMAVWATFLIDHFELFGLRQVWRYLRDEPAPKPVFRERSLYRYVRHPMQLGVLIGLWSTPQMSLSHLLLAAGMTVYVLIGLYFEERDLLQELGPDYADYRRRVPQLLPGAIRRGRG